MLINIDPMGRITSARYINPDAAKIMGYTEKDVLGKNVTDFIIEAQTIAGAEHFGRLYADDGAFHASSRNVKTKSGEIVSLESFMVPLHDSDGKFIGHCGMEFIRKQ